MTRILLREDVDRAAIDELAHQRGWPLLNIFRRREGRPRQVTFGTAEWLLTYIEDHRIAASYIVIHGHDPESLASALRAALPTLTLDDAIALHDEDPVRAVCWLAVLGPATPEPPVASILARAADAEDASLRAAAEFAYEALEWPR